MMEEAYSNLKLPSGLSSISKLYTHMKKTNKKIKKSEVKSFLASKDSYTLHRKTRNRFSRRKFLVKQSGIILMGDVCYMNPYEKENTPYLLVLMDMYSRFLTVFPLVSLKSSHVCSILDNFFQNSIYKYQKFFTDEGVEFVNKQVKNLYVKHNIHWYTTYSKSIKVSPVERVILTLKNKIKRFITHYNNEKYLDVLDDIVNTYNSTPHRGLNGKLPLDIHLMINWEDIKTFSQTLYRSHFTKTKSVGGLLQKNLVVRIPVVRNLFSRAIHVCNTSELFRIKNVNINHVPVTYTLEDLEGNEILGIFYREELTTAKEPETYAIQIIRKRKRRGKTEFLIKYVNYPASSQEWVDKSRLEKLS